MKVTDDRRVPTLCIAQDARELILTYAEQSPAEVNGFAYVHVVDGDIYLTSPEDVFITDQVVTPGSAHVAADTIMAALDRAVVDGRAGQLHLQWHSHGAHDAYHSATDMATIDRYRRGWMVSVVVNSRRELVARYDVYQPVHVGLPMPVIDYYDPASKRAMIRNVRASMQQHVQRAVNLPDLAQPGQYTTTLVGLYDPDPIITVPALQEVTR